jgi:hypothetical protein
MFVVYRVCERFCILPHDGVPQLGDYPTHQRMLLIGGQIGIGGIAQPDGRKQRIAYLFGVEIKTPQKVTNCILCTGHMSVFPQS